MAYSFTILVPITICLLAANAVLSAFRSPTDPWDAANCALLVVLFCCLSASDRLPDGSKGKMLLKLPICFLVFAAYFLITYRVAILDSGPLRYFIWALLTITTLSFLYTFFAYPIRDGNTGKLVDFKFCDGTCSPLDSKV